MPMHSRRQDYPTALRALPRRDLMIGTALTILLASQATSRSAPSRDPSRIIIGGTGMALATMRRIADAFVTGEPGVTVDVLPSLGTGGGLSAATAGAIDIALSARQLNDAERAKGLQSHPYACTPMAFVTPPATAIDGITLADVAAIFAGTMTTWPDGTGIRLIRREPSDADWSMLRGVSEAMAQVVEIALRRPGLLTVATDQENGDALERLRGSFGAMSIGQLRAEARRLKPLALDGVMPSVEAISSGRYKLSRTLYAVWRAAARPEITRFLAFLRSEQTVDLLATLGHIPLSGSDA